MKKIIGITIISCLLIFLSIIMIKTFNKPKFYKESNQENITEENLNTENKEKEETSKTENTNSIEQSINLSEKEENQTKEIGKAFIEGVHGYVLDNSHEDKVMKATEYATESMKSFMIGTFINSKQPVLHEGFFARVVDNVKPVEYKIYDDSIMWEYNVYSNILNKQGELINTESNIINLLFVKENGEWKVGEYSTTQYRG
ncbi:MAG: hypothetical protein ACLS9F_19340 [Clostridium paraputrificum]